MKTTKILIGLAVVAGFTACLFGMSQATSNQNSTENKGSLVHLWQHLSSFNQTVKENAVIHLHLRGDATSQQRLIAGLIESSWKAGKYEEAIKQLKVFEAMGTPVSLGVAWKTPVPVGTNAAWSGSDVRVGAPRAGTSRVMLADGRDHILATILWSTGESKGWSMNVSADDGATWSETYHLY
ncbi:MAG: hypothetical protein ACYS4W_07845, partial [Planctomycetota bacterium]